MTESAARIPTATGVVDVPASLSNKQLFDCAQASIAELSRTSSSWPAVSLRDDGKGLLESGDYPANDKTGLRMHLERAEGAGLVRISLKGAGAYYVDLGVDQALKDLSASMQRCIQAPSA